MSENKQIAKIIADNFMYGYYSDEAFEKAAEKLQEAGWHKQSEGEWKISKIGDGDRVRTCSACHISQSVNVYKGKVMFRYCPYCGAKMKGV